MALQAGDFADLIRTTLRRLGRGKVTDLLSTLQRFPAARRLINKNKVDWAEGGYEAQFDAVVGNNGSARGVPLGWTANPNIVDGIIQGQVPFRHSEFNYSVIRQEKSMNIGTARIVDLIMARRKHAMASWIEYLEKRFWRVPAVSNTVDFYGVPYWIVKSATAAAETEAANFGFNGTVPSGYSTVANISSTTYKTWRNGSDAYTQVTKDDLIRKLRYMFYAVVFESPVEGMNTFNKGDEYGLYMNYTTGSRMREVAEDQNEDVGMDLAAFESGVMVNSRPIEIVPELRGDTTNPVYGINWGEFGVMGLRDEWMHETRIEKNPHQPSVYTVYTETSLNTICRDRRRQFVISNGTTEMS